VRGSERELEGTRGVFPRLIFTNLLNRRKLQLEIPSGALFNLEV